MRLEKGLEAHSLFSFDTSPFQTTWTTFVRAFMLSPQCSHISQHLQARCAVDAGRRTYQYMWVVGAGGWGSALLDSCPLGPPHNIENYVIASL